MNTGSKLLLTLASLALVLYVIGFKTGTFAIIIMAVCVEVWFWFKLLFSDKQVESSSDQ